MNLTVDFATIRTRLDQLARRTMRGAVPAARSEWGGAGVVICATAPPPSDEGFYPDPRYVVTANSLQLSWLFSKLGSVFQDSLDHVSKIEFYGRLANAANSYLASSKPEVRRELLLAVHHEVYAMVDELAAQTFRCLGVAVGREIADDTRENERGFVSIEETMSFFVGRGIDPNDGAAD